MGNSSSPHPDKYSYYAVLCLMVQLHSGMNCFTLKIQFQHNLCLVWVFFALYTSEKGTAVV